MIITDLTHNLESLFTKIKCSLKPTVIVRENKYIISKHGWGDQNDVSLVTGFLLFH